jgi:outer membrane protein assembly factor BamB
MKPAPVKSIFSCLAFLVAMTLLSVSCKKPEETAVPPVQPVIEETELAPLTIPELDHALITFIVGDAWIIQDTEELFIDIGSYLKQGQSLKVDTGYVELQLGDIGSIRVQENTTIRLDDIVISPQAGSARIEVVVGSVLNKVDKIARDGSYQLRTPTAVMGVRGTEFGVHVANSGDTRVAVRQGRVALAPRSADPERFLQRAGAAGALDESVEAAIRELELRSMVLEPEEEASIDEKANRSGVSAVEDIESLIADIEAKAAGGETVSPAKLARDLEKLVEESATSLNRETEQSRRSLSAQSREELREIDEIRIIPAALSETLEEEGAVNLLPVTISVEPENAEIFLNGRPVGRGRFSAIFLPDEELSFSFRLAGWESTELSFTVKPDSGSIFKVQLTQLTKDSEVSNVPEVPAVPEVPGPEKSDQQLAPPINPVEEPEAGQEKAAVAVAAAEAEAPETEELPSKSTLTASTVPGNALLRINGQESGMGSVTREFEIGETVRIEASLPGYAPASQTVRISSGQENISLKLNPKPFEARIPVSSSPFIRSLASNETLVFGVDRDGTLYAIHPLEGRMVWQVSTANNNNENSRPIVSGNRLAFSGGSELLILEASTGRELTRKPLSGTWAHLFGRTMTAWNSQWLFPTDDELVVLDSNGNDTGNRIPLPGGSKMSSTLVGNRLVTADQQGNVLVIDPSNRNILRTIATKMLQPLAHSPAHDGTHAYFSGRRGNVAAVNVEKGTVQWESILPGGQGSYVDPLFADPVVFFLVRNTIYALDKNNGESRFVLEDAAGAPVLHDGEVYYATVKGELLRINSSNGSITARVALSAPASAAPASIGKRIMVPLENGNIAVIHSDGIQ